MLDINKISKNPDCLINSLKSRCNETALKDVELLIEYNTKLRELTRDKESLNMERNRRSSEIGREKKEGKDVTDKMNIVRDININIKNVEEDIRSLNNKIRDIILNIPNIPHTSVPEGRSSDENKEIKRWGERPDFKFKTKSHIEIGEDLDILDFKRATKITGSRFVIYKGKGALLARALINFMLDIHTTEHGYKEISPPFLVNLDSMTGTGQMPKFKNDLFSIEKENLFLIPTAEVPITNIHRDEIIKESSLPLLYAAYTPCFRREAGSYGKETSGLIRQHQFDKVELVKFVSAHQSYDELESLLLNAEEILSRLGLHYRVVLLCTGDIGFSASKTYDIEVWLPSQNGFREISSCSNFEDFQSRRAKIRTKRENIKKTELVHTLNGSGVAVGRLMVAIMENYQQEDGSIKIPEALQAYMGDMKEIKNN